MRERDEGETGRTRKNEKEGSKGRSEKMEKMAREDDDNLLLKTQSRIDWMR